MDEDLREVERCLEEATRIESVRREVENIQNKLQRYVYAYLVLLVRAFFLQYKISREVNVD